MNKTCVKIKNPPEYYELHWYAFALLMSTTTKYIGAILEEYSGKMQRRINEEVFSIL